ncbi:hypothetical protein [Marinobacter sp. NFXS9]|uniref:hypothetical protein n=1 Tax=Marinobacter sp. NFXS9 TaxID=2818433 RepID=UPI0032E04D41
MGVSRHDIHVLDRFIKPFGSILFVLFLAFASLVLGAFLSIHNSDWTWFSRFGSVITVSGLLLVSSPVFDQGVYRAHAKAFAFGSKDEHGDSKVTDEESRQTGNKVLVGIVVSIAGTLVWGFGDLLGRISVC